MFVYLSPLLWLGFSNWSLSAASRSRPRRDLCLQLLRLPQDHGIYVRLQLHHCRHAPEASPRPWQADLLEPKSNHRLRQYHDQLLLFHVRLALVPCQFRSARREHPSHWHRGWLSSSWDEAEAPKGAVHQEPGRVVQWGGRGQEVWGTRPSIVVRMLATWKPHDCTGCILIESLNYYIEFLEKARIFGFVNISAMVFAGTCHSDAIQLLKGWLQVVSTIFNTGRVVF